MVGGVVFPITTFPARDLTLFSLRGLLNFCNRVSTVPREGVMASLFI